jgi:CRISPR-associated protein Csx16
MLETDTKDTEALTEAIDALLCSRPRGLTPHRIYAYLPRREVDPDWAARQDAGDLSGRVGSLREVWPLERLSPEQAHWILALREHMSWRALASCVVGDGNQITGMDLEEAARRALDLGEIGSGTGEERPSAHAPRTYFVTRHSGALDWAEQEGIAVDELVDHLEVERIQPGDRVIGSLPCNLAAEVCALGGRYLHLTLELPADLRGKELTAADMRRLGARVEEFRVEGVQ